MRYPQTFIDDLRRQADIVRVISDYVTLKKKGANWMACCPFHQEKTPSFSVNPSKNIFYCFGCGKGGSVFNFVMEMESVSFPEAVRVVAEKAGVPLPQLVDDKKFEARRKEADEVVELNSWALEFWERQLAEENVEARAAREYVESRGLTDETRRLFRLGYAPNSWDALGSYLKSKGATVGQIERSGLVVKKDAGGYYDRFRGRLIFPVTDAQGRAVAFGARAMRAGEEPKYLNSPETAAYTKGRHLFGLGVSREEIRKKRFSILVEGYLDLIILFQSGVRNVVAGLGTALTTEQAKLLRRFAHRVVVNYDGDRAGIKAAKRAIETLLAENFEIKVLILPDNADPDEFIKKEGAEEYETRRGKVVLSPTEFVKLRGIEEYKRHRGAAIPFIQFIIDQAVHERNIRVATEKAEAVNEVLPLLRAVRDKIQQRGYFDYAMDRLLIEPTLQKDLWKLVSSTPTAESQQAVKRKVIASQAGEVTLAERRLLELLVHDAELRESVLPHMEESDYEELPSGPVFRALKELHARGSSVDFSTLGPLTEGDAVAADLVPLVLMHEPERAEGEATDQFLAEAESCLTTLRLMNLDRRIKELAAEIAEADRAGDEARRDRLIMEDLDLKRRRSALLPSAGGVTAGGHSSFS